MKPQQGFSLVELLVVFAILAILAVIAVPQLIQYRERAQDASALASVDGLSTAVLAALYQGVSSQQQLNQALDVPGSDASDYQTVRINYNSGDVRLTAQASGENRFVQYQLNAQSRSWQCQTVTSLAGGIPVASADDRVKGCD